MEERERASSPFFAPEYSMKEMNDPLLDGGRLYSRDGGVEYSRARCGAGYCEVYLKQRNWRHRRSRGGLQCAIWIAAGKGSNSASCDRSLTEIRLISTPIQSRMPKSSLEIMFHRPSFVYDVSELLVSCYGASGSSIALISHWTAQ